MTIREILDKYDEQNRWTLRSKLELCIRYIERQQDNETFEDFIDTMADKETHYEIPHPEE